MKILKIFSSIFVITLFLAGCTPAADTNYVQIKTYDLAEISKHATKDNCWIAIHDKVYDVTQMISKHGGGDTILEGCGKEATVLFETRPMGSKTPHSDKAIGALKNFFIGELKK